MTFHLTTPGLDNLQQASETTLAETSRSFGTRTGENQLPYRTPRDTPAHKRVSMDTRSSLANRRQSVRDHKAPLGPRPAEFSPSKRVISDSSAFYSPSAARTNVPNTISEPFLGLSARRNATMSDSKSALGTSGSLSNAQSKPAMPLDPTSNTRQTRPVKDARLEDFPPPGSFSRRSLYQNGEESQRQRVPSAINNTNLVNGSADVRASVRSRPSTSPMRQNNSPALRAAQLSSGPPASVPVSTPLNIKTRRQSQLPPSSSTITSMKQPRKSIGPGFKIANTREKTVFDPASRSFVPDRPSVAANETRREPSSLGLAISRSTAGSTPVAWAEDTVSTQARRQAKTISLQQAPITLPRGNMFSEPPLPLIAPLASSESQRGSRPPAHLIVAQQPASKRQSAAAGHVGGLGARTISPTDVRRSRRMSTVAQLPRMPTRSPTPELTFGARPPPTPPVVSIQKYANMNSTVPSRAVSDIPDMPDINQLNLLTRSGSSRSSYSARPSSSSSQHRPSYSNGTVRSPINKPRNVHSSAGGETGLVPPVPAIPKAYESPTDASDKPCFPGMVTTFGNANHRLSDEKDEERFMTPVEDAQEVSAIFQDARQSRRITLNGRQEPQKDTVNGASRQQVTTSRLPPINLLPLSTPTTTRIASFAQQRNEAIRDKATPPPYRGPPKTPSTPMTASKATFPTFDMHKSFDMNAFPQFRSSTAYASQRPESSALDGSDSESPAVFARASPATPRHGPSPFGSFSLPRLNGEMQHLVPRHSRDEYNNASQSQTRLSKTVNTRSSTVSKVGKDLPQPSNGTNSESEALPAGSSLRRKLSFGWRRSSSKASHSSQHLDEDYHVPSSNEMPPPKIPASATRNSSKMKSPKPTTNSNQIKAFESRAALERLPHQTTSAIDVSASAPKPAAAGTERGLPSVRSSGSLFSMHKMLGSRSSQGNIRNQRNDGALDRGDVAAEEEMRKLASKRKEFETAAKELDELRRKATAKERVTPSQASRMAALNIFERGEIVDYLDVYFCGAKNAQKFVGNLNSEGSNFGFDDERGDYNIVAGDHLAYRYEVVDILGKGSFGQVVRCVDHKTGKLVAIKIIRNKKRFHQQALVEVNILQKLREWDPHNAHSMINFTQSFYFRGHLCISTELLGINLYEFIKAHDFSGFSLKLIRRFTKQMLGSLCLLQVHNVIHCDLKPENILLAHPLRSEIKTIDFGSSCFESEKVYTYIQSRFYRSPEVILGMTYGMPIDMWSLGCILAELYTGYPIFPGENEQEQLACIMEVFGPPEKHLIERSTRKKLFFDSLGKPRATVSSKGKRRRPSSKTLAQALKCDDELFTDFIARCLRWDPDRRIKPDEAMAHEFVTAVRKSSHVRTQATQNTATPVRGSNTQTPSKTKSQPEIAANNLKSGGTTSGARDGSNQSPVKSGPRRKSSMFEKQNTTKWGGNANGGASALPRVSQTQRSTPAKPDMASAASAAAMSSLSKGSKAKNRSAA